MSGRGFDRGSTDSTTTSAGLTEAPRGPPQASGGAGPGSGIPRTSEVSAEDWQGAATRSARLPLLTTECGTRLGEFKPITHGAFSGTSVTAGETEPTDRLVHTSTPIPSKPGGPAPSGSTEETPASGLLQHHLGDGSGNGQASLAGREPGQLRAQRQLFEDQDEDFSSFLFVDTVADVSPVLSDLAESEDGDRNGNTAGSSAGRTDERESQDQDSSSGQARARSAPAQQSGIVDLTSDAEEDDTSRPGSPFAEDDEDDTLVNDQVEDGDEESSDQDQDEQQLVGGHANDQPGNQQQQQGPNVPQPGPAGQQAAAGAVPGGGGPNPPNVGAAGAGADAATMATPSIRLPEFSGEVGQASEFFRQIENLATIMNWADDKKLQYAKAGLRNGVGSHIDQAPAADVASYAQVKKIITDLYDDPRAGWMIKRDLMLHKRAKGQSVISYVTALRKYQQCGATDADLLAAFINGLGDPLGPELARKDDLESFSKAVAVAMRLEGSVPTKSAEANSIEAGQTSQISLLAQRVDQLAQALTPPTPQPEPLPDLYAMQARDAAGHISYDQRPGYGQGAPPARFRNKEPYCRIHGTGNHFTSDCRQIHYLVDKHLAQDTNYSPQKPNQNQQRYGRGGGRGKFRYNNSRTNWGPRDHSNGMGDVATGDSQQQQQQQGNAQRGPPRAAGQNRAGRN